MEITCFSAETASLAHQGTILASGVLPFGVKAPFEHAWGYLDRPGEMEVHSHHKEEVYFFFRGEGFVVVDGEKRAVKPGDVVRVPPDSMHSVVNERTDELLWAAFWWDIIE